MFFVGFSIVEGLYHSISALLNQLISLVIHRQQLHTQNQLSNSHQYYKMISMRPFSLKKPLIILTHHQSFHSLTNMTYQVGFNFWCHLLIQSFFHPFFYILFATTLTQMKIKIIFNHSFVLIHPFNTYLLFHIELNLSILFVITVCYQSWTIVQQLPTTNCIHLSIAILIHFLPF